MNNSDQRLREIVVGIWQGSDCLGAGVLLEPDKVLTCAHVIAPIVKGKRQPHAGMWELRFKGGDTMPVSADMRSIQFHATFDLAVISIQGLRPTHTAKLRSAPLGHGDDFHAYGFPSFAVTGQSVDGCVVGIREDGKLQVRIHGTGSGQLNIAGMSGSPLMRDGKVVGILATARVDHSGAVVAETAYAIPIQQAHKEDPSFFGSPPEMPTLEHLLWLQKEMRRNHVFGNIPCEDVPRVDGLPWMPLEDIYVEPDVSWSMPDKGEGPAKNSILSALQEQSTRVAIIDQGFGAGKSLTARTLSCQLAEAYLVGEDSEIFFPVFLPCPHLPSVGDLTSLLKHSLSEPWADRLDSSGSDLFEALNRAKGLKVLWIIDGLDEVGVSDATVRSLFEQAVMWNANRPLHRFAFFCRTHTANAINKHKSAKTWFKKSTLRRFSLCHFDRGQREKWLSQWSRLKDQQLKEEDRETLLTEETYNVPLLLLMGVLAANDSHRGVNVPLRGSKTLLYEFFCTWVATGRWEAYQEELTPLEQRASEIPRDTLFDGLELVDGWGPEGECARQAVASLLFLLSRLAWESIVQEQKARCTKEPGDFDVLGKDVLKRVLGELNLDMDTIPVLDSVLLSAQGSGNSNASTFLFGHKSFREYLAVRFHLSVFAHMALANQGNGISSADKRAQPYTEIIGSGDLLDYSRATIKFLLGVSDLPTTNALRPLLPAWCVREYENPTMIFPTSGQATHTNERRAIWRLTAAALRSAFSAPDHRHKITDRAFHELTILHHLRRALSVRANASALVLRSIAHPGLNLLNTDLSQADLNGANLSRANLSGTLLALVKLSQADLSGADLIDTCLNGAFLIKTNLSGADLSGADLTEAFLIETNLSGADLSRADLSNACLGCADLCGANLYKANLSQADLRGADLRGADLRGADLSEADLTNTKHNEYTQWPDGFEPPTL